MAIYTVSFFPRKSVQRSDHIIESHMSSGQLTIICLPDSKLDQSPSQAEIEEELNKVLAGTELGTLSRLQQGIYRVVVSPYPFCTQAASLFLSTTQQLMIDSEALSSAPIPVHEGMSQWVELSGFAEKWYSLPEHLPLNYAIATTEEQGVVAVLPLSCYQRYAGSASVLRHTLVEYGKVGAAPKPLFPAANAHKAVLLPFKPAVFSPSKHDFDREIARLQVAVVGEIQAIAIPQHQQRAEALKTSLLTTATNALSGHYTITTEFKAPYVPFSDSNTRAMSSELMKVMEKVVTMHTTTKSLQEKFAKWGYR